MLPAIIALASAITSNQWQSAFGAPVKLDENPIYVIGYSSLDSEFYVPRYYHNHNYLEKCTGDPNTGNNDPNWHEPFAVLRDFNRVFQFESGDVFIPAGYQYVMNLHSKRTYSRKGVDDFGNPTYLYPAMDWFYYVDVEGMTISRRRFLEMLSDFEAVATIDELTLPGGGDGDGDGDGE